jgi:hypothetical protein
MWNCILKNLRSPFAADGTQSFYNIRNCALPYSSASVDVMRDGTQVEALVPIGAEHPCDTVGSRRTMCGLIPVPLCQRSSRRVPFPLRSASPRSLRLARSQVSGERKLHELIGDGLLTTATVGRRRLVLVKSLLSLIEAKHHRRALSRARHLRDRKGFRLGS